MCACACHLDRGDLALLRRVAVLAADAQLVRLVVELDTVLEVGGVCPPAVRQLRAAASALLVELGLQARERREVATGDATAEPVPVVDAERHLEYDGALVVGEAERGGDLDGRSADDIGGREAVRGRAQGAVEVRAQGVGVAGHRGIVPGGAR